MNFMFKKLNLGNVKIPKIIVRLQNIYFNANMISVFYIKYVVSLFSKNAI